MRPGWVAGSVRARLLAERRIGRVAAGELASLEPAGAVARLAASPYGHDVEATMGLAQASRAVARTALWNMRVLAGWLTPGGADLVRLMAGGFEIDNTEGRLAALGGTRPERAFDLGALAVADRRLARAASPAELRAVLARSSWGDPGGEEPYRVAAGLRIAWAYRLAERSGTLAPWAEAGAAVVVARERFAYDRTLSEPTLREARRLIGRAWEHGQTLEDFVAGLPRSLRWPFESVGVSEEMWRAEAAWWRRVEVDALSLLLRWSARAETIIAVVALLLVDVWRVRAALSACAWGGRAREIFDAIA